KAAAQPRWNRNLQERLFPGSRQEFRTPATSTTSTSTPIPAPLALSWKVSYSARQALSFLLGRVRRQVHPSPDPSMTQVTCPLRFSLGERGSSHFTARSILGACQRRQGEHSVGAGKIGRASCRESREGS